MKIEIHKFYLADTDLVYVFAHDTNKNGERYAIAIKVTYLLNPTAGQVRHSLDFSHCFTTIFLTADGCEIIWNEEENTPLALSWQAPWVNIIPSVQTQSRFEQFLWGHSNNNLNSLGEDLCCDFEALGKFLEKVPQITEKLDSTGHTDKGDQK